MTPHELFRLTGLTPQRDHKTAKGRCACDSSQTVTLYLRADEWMCDVCIAASQTYPMGPDSKGRFIGGNFLLVSLEDGTDFWGKHRLTDINPKIRVHSPEKAVAGIYRNLILKPPTPPWMFIVFGKWRSSAANFVVTDDNNFIRISNDMTKHGLREVCRSQVLAMMQVGLTLKEWNFYLEQYATQNPDNFDKLRALEDAHPALAAICYLPPLESPEHRMLKKAMGDIDDI